MTRPAGARAHGPRPVTASAGCWPRGDLGGPGSATAARTPPGTDAQITPNTLARAYAHAGYFARNARAIEVFIDRDTATSGTAAAGERWQYYDLGHGWCTYTFFEQCPHRMACAKCDFYTPKDSSKALLLEAKDNLQRMLTAVSSQTTSGPPPNAAGRSLRILPGCPPDLALAETMTPAPTGTSAIQVITIEVVADGEWLPDGSLTSWLGMPAAASRIMRKARQPGPPRRHCADGGQKLASMTGYRSSMS